MSCKLVNQTPLPAHLTPLEDPAGRAGWLLLAKCSWRLDNGRMAPAEDQAPLHLLPVRHRLGALDLDDVQREALGERANEDVVWIDHELVPPKPAFDVLVAGYITAPAGHAGPFVDAGLVIGKHRVGIRGHVPRRWRSGLMGTTAEALAPTVRRVPLTCAVADWECGIATELGADPIAELPWIEAPDHPARCGRAGKHPAGFGPWPTSAAHRRRYAGTYDKAWQQQRMPRLPLDLDPRFYNVAHPDLQLPRVPEAGCEIALVNLGPAPVVRTTMPALELAARCVNGRGETSEPQALRADTLTIEPDHHRMSLTWRAFFPDQKGADGLRSVTLFKPRQMT